VSIRNSAVKNDTELKNWWLKHGEVKEHEFVELMATKRPDLMVSMNPRKEVDPTVCDLIYGNAGKSSDLKCQMTPFFSAKQYGMDSKYTFTFNSKDYVRYKELYPEIDLFVWVDWKQTELKLGNRNWKTEPYHAIYKISLKDIEFLVDAGQAPLHSYQRRSVSEKKHPLKGHVDKKGNATASYLINLKLFDPMIILMSNNVVEPGLLKSA
jgi:hypothetical protein